MDISKEIEFLKEKVSKKQIVAVLAIISIMMIEIPPDTKYLPLLILAKIIAITLLAGYAIHLQTNLDKEKNNVKEEINIESVPD